MCCVCCALTCWVMAMMVWCGLRWMVRRQRAIRCPLIRKTAWIKWRSVLVVMAVDVTLMMTRCAAHVKTGKEIVVINAMNGEKRGGRRVMTGEGIVVIVIIEMNAEMKWGEAAGKGVEVSE